MNIVIVQHTVADYAQWKVGYDGHEPARKASGCTSATIGRTSVGADGSTDITVCMQFPDLATAKGFLDNPDLAVAMKDAGVVGIPNVQITELVESVTY